MFVSPQTLREYCLDFLRNTIHNQTSAEDESSICAKAAEDVLTVDTINGHLIEELLESLSLNGQLTDDVLLRPLFDCRSTQLRCVRIADASRLTTRGLRALKGHRIHELVVSGLQKCTINELIGCLGDQCLQRLRSLNVSFSAFTASNKFCVVVGLAKLQALRALDVSHTDFNHHGLEIVVSDLPLLQNLNISNTRVKDISPLKKCKDRLTALSIYNLRSGSGGGQDFVAVVLELRQLVHLDVSDDRDNPLDVLTTQTNDCTAQLLLTPQAFPRLRSLDLSGREGVDSTQLTRFLRHKERATDCDTLQFLGLMQCSVAFDPHVLSANDSDLVVSGNGSEAQIKEALKRYRLRPSFVQKSLFYLYNYTQTFCDPRPDLIRLIVAAMHAHRRHIAIQMAATACLYNLTKAEFGDRTHPNLLTIVVQHILEAMQTFPNHQQLQKNALLTLCSDRILQEVTFDRCRTTELVLDSLVAFKETPMNRMAVAIVSILAAKISTAETSSLGAKAVYMEALLDIVRTRVNAGADNDVMLKFTLSALWNLTDESPNTCQMFLKKGGMALYLSVLKAFSGESAVETKVLGLLNNIAEVSHLRHHLMETKFFNVLRLLLGSSKIDVSYFAAGIFAHLSSESRQTAAIKADPEVDLNSILDELVTVVLNWETPEVEMVAYRSFMPFLPLLRCSDTPAVQLWAIWAIHHVCSKNPKRYCQMLVEEDGAESIRRIVETSDPSAAGSLTTYCQKTLEVVRKEFPNLVVI